MKSLPKNYLSSNRFFVLMLVFLLSIGSIFIVNTWKTTSKNTIEYSKRVALATASGFQGSVLQRLTGSDTSLDEYKEIEQSLNGLTDHLHGIAASYIYKQNNNQLYLLAESGANNYSGQSNLLANSDFFIPFKNGEVHITKPYSDNNGSWISVLAPIKNFNQSEIIAVFAIDFPAASWNNQAIINTFFVAFVVLCIILIFTILFILMSQKNQLNLEKQRLLCTDKKLKDSETLFRTIFNQAPIGIAIGRNDKFIADNNENVPCVNPMFEKITGRSRSELSNTSWVDMTHPDDIEKTLEKFTKFNSGELDSFTMEKRYVRPGKPNAWICMSISPLRLNGNSNIKHLYIVEDISKRKKMEQALSDSERSKTVLLDNLPGMAYRCLYDHNWTMQFVSQGCFPLTGYYPQHLLNNNKISFNNIIAPKYRDDIYKKWITAVKGGSKFQYEYEITTANGGLKWVWEQGQAVHDQNGEVIALEGFIMDITNRKTQEIKEKYYNDHDYMTGLYNRKYFIETLNHELKNKHENKAVLLVNLRRFSTINLNYGYQFGENLIKQLAKRLSSLCNQRIELFQLSIDRFIFYIKNYKGADELDAMCNSVFYIIDNVIASKVIGYNIGVVEIDNLKDDVESIIKNASLTVETISEKHMIGYGFFNREMEAGILRENIIINELSCIAKGEKSGSLYLMYQPIICLKTDSICCFEVLARLQIEQLGLIPPKEFIPIAEKTDLIIPLGKIIMRMALMFLKQLENQGYGSLTVSVNISVIQLLSHNFLPDLIQIIKETQVNSHNICFELTESVFSDNYKIINEKLEKIKELGIKVSIDDFGTGYSSLARERELNIDLIKIDKYFLDKLTSTKENKKSITGDIISMAHKQGHEVIAEGVETEIQKQYLTENNCDYMQGYYFSRPISKEAIFELIKRTSSNNC